MSPELVRTQRVTVTSKPDMMIRTAATKAMMIIMMIINPRHFDIYHCSLIMIINCWTATMSASRETGPAQSDKEMTSRLLGYCSR